MRRQIALRQTARRPHDAKSLTDGNVEFLILHAILRLKCNTSRSFLRWLAHGFLRVIAFDQQTQVMPEVALLSLGQLSNLHLDEILNSQWVVAVLQCTFSAYCRYFFQRVDWACQF